MKLAREIAKELRDGRAKHLFNTGMEEESIIAAKLEPVREALKRAHNGESARDIWEDIGKALAMLSEEDK